MTIAAAAAALVERWGKTAVSCADTPGFIVNRMLSSYRREMEVALEELNALGRHDTLYSRRLETLETRFRLQRAIGVIYRPETERQSHYFRASMGEQFDVVIHYDETSALEDLQVLGDRGLAQVQLACCARESSLLDNRGEETEVM